MNANLNSQAALSQAISLWRAGRQQDARMLCEGLAAERNPEALSLLAELCVAAGEVSEATRHLQDLSRLAPSDAAVHRRLGNALLAQGSAAEAAASYRRAIALEPANARAHGNLGQALMQLGNANSAAVHYRRALELDPNYAIAHNNLGIVHFEQQRYDDALACYQRAVELNPGFAQAHHNCGNALLKLKRYEQALGHYERAVALEASLADSWFHRGDALAALKRAEPAVESYQHALTLKPDHAGLLCNCASALLTLKRPEDALACCERALQIDPAMPEVHNNLAGAWRALHAYEQAEAACRRALELKAGYAEALSNLGNLMLAQRRAGEAIGYCDQAIALQPSLAEAHHQRAGALLIDKRPDEAAASYERLLSLDPTTYGFARGTALYARLVGCDWDDYDRRRGEICQAVAAGETVMQPFSFLAICDEPALQLQCARAYVTDQRLDQYPAAWTGARYQHDRMRVAYLSADLHQHATADLAAGLFESHDRGRFETVAISYGPDDGSAMRRRLIGAFDQFIDVRAVGDAQVVELMRSLEIDIAVDLKGYTSDCRPGILARRAAPVQVSFLGYPGTTALKQIDYVIADQTVLPPPLQQFYTEQVVYLPHCYQVNDARRVLPSQLPTREEVGLPASAFVFCCFNNNYKISPSTFDLWLQLLRAVPGSVLWLLNDNEVAVANLRREAARRAVGSERLVFAPRVPVEQHLARHQLADLSLDTLPYNAHTTCSDALWAGLPVLTCPGQTFQGRVAASLLQAMGVPELIATDQAHYRQLALGLAFDRGRLSGLRSRIEQARRAQPLFDTARFCRYLEDAYETMWRRQLQSEPPIGFAVAEYGCHGTFIG
jgi:protein O-GlcNAc transferase